MTQFETITLAFESRGVARLTLNRPARYNAFNATMISELTQAVQQLGNNPAVRVVVFTGEGRDFCAGADLEWMKQQFDAAPQERTQEAKRLAEMLRSIDETPKFVIGVVQGAAYGGGVGLVSVCDLVIASPGAQFALTETKLGLIPATIGPYLNRRIGGSAMRRLALHGEQFGAADAKMTGLVSHIAAEDEIAALAERHIVQALTCAPGAIAEAKRLFRRIASGQADEKETIEALTRRWSADEARAGIAAFFNKEKAPWQS